MTQEVTKQKDYIPKGVRKGTYDVYIKINDMLEAGVPWTEVLQEFEKARKKWERDAFNSR